MMNIWRKIVGSHHWIVSQHPNLSHIFMDFSQPPNDWKLWRLRRCSLRSSHGGLCRFSQTFHCSLEEWGDGPQIDDQFIDFHREKARETPRVWWKSHEITLFILISDVRPFCKSWTGSRNHDISRLLGQNGLNGRAKTRLQTSSISLSLLKGSSLLALACHMLRIQRRCGQVSCANERINVAVHG
jgi:hypothetical protein